MSLRKNVLANYASQFYVAGISILILPLYIKYMGAEAYGLVGFFTMLQVWFALLDMGLTPTIARETARFHGGTMSSLQFRQLLRALSIIFVSVALFGGGVLWMLAESIANNWLQTGNLSTQTVVVAVQIMAVSVALRWLGGLYRGVITGSEKLVWLSGFNFIIATLRFPAVFISMWIYGYTPLVFFWHQLAVVLIEVSGLYIMSNRLKPLIVNEQIGWSFRPVAGVIKFALTIAFTSSVWVLVTQSDKLVLSGILTLGEYGYFTLAVMLSSGIMIISSPLFSAIQPRLTRLYAENDIDNFLSLYSSSARFVTTLSFTIALIIAFFPYQILYAWTGDTIVAEKTYEILRFYVLGSGFLALSAFPSYLQIALGNLKYHLIGNLILLFCLVPSSIYMALKFGGVGSAYVWCLLNFCYLLGWVSFTHYKLIPGHALNWLLKGFIVPMIPFVSLLMVLKIFFISDISLTRAEAFIQVFLLTLSCIFIMAISVRNIFLKKMRAKK